jgi:hypothetical protein
MTDSNKKAVVELIKRYSTISLDEIKKEFEKGLSLRQIKMNLTGFSSLEHCSLCLSVNEDCYLCIHYLTERKTFGCINSFTYKTIIDADTPELLLTAYKARSIYLQSLLDDCFMDRRLSIVLNAYLECALFCENLDSGRTKPAFDAESKTTAIEDIKKLISLTNEMADDWDDSEFGHDFWYTRNGHGTGFWSRDEKTNGDAISEIVKNNFKEVNIIENENTLAIW